MNTQHDELKKFKYQDKEICASQIFADPTYNRFISKKQVSAIVDNFNPNLVNDLKVSYRDDKYWIFDGNHTLKALIQRAGKDNIYVKCRVYFGMTKEDEARMFALQNGISRKVSNNYKLRALNIAKDPEVNKFKDACAKAGAQCSFTATNAAYHIKCYDAAYKIYLKRGEEHFVNVLKMIIRTWSGSPDSLRKEIICGMDILLYTFPEIDIERLKYVLHEIAPKTIIAKGKADVYFTGYKRFAAQMAKAYTKKLKKNSKVFINIADLMG